MVRYIITVLLMFCWSRTASAEFSVIGRSCVPDNATINSHILTVDAGGPIFHRIQSAGTVTFYCAIPVNVPNPANLWLGYIDNTAGAITAQYMKMDKTTGVVTSVAQIDTDGASASYRQDEQVTSSV